MTSVLIDTNIYSDAMRGLAPAVQILKTADEVLLSPVIIAELLIGFKGGKREGSNREQLARFLVKDRVRVPSITEETSDRYSFIFLNLKNAGTPIPTNDIWIAATAMEQGAKLATRDRHFLKIKGIYLYSPTIHH